MHTNTVAPQRGYTLLELLTALTIMLILTTLALPSFSSMVRRTQSETVIRSLTDAYQLARSAAISQCRIVIFCAKTNTHTCGGDWTQGAIVFIDSNNNRLRDANEPLLADIAPPPSGSQLVMKAALGKQYLRFMESGALDNTAGSLIYCPPRGVARDARNLIFSRTGHLRLGGDNNRDGITENAAGQPLTCPAP